MTLFFYTGAGDDLGVAVRLGEGFSVTEAADNGIVAMSSFRLDDPDGSASLSTLEAMHINETACTPARLFSGYLADLTVGRADSLRTGSARRWDCTLSDLNFNWQRKALRASTANRPAETDLVRIAWLLDEIGIADHGLVSSTGGVNLDATDYRDRYAADVMGDCATASSKNWFAYFDDDTGDTSLFYDVPTAAVYSSTLRMTNDLADVDNDTTFYALASPQLVRDPSRKAAGIDLVWQGGSTYVHDTDLGFTRDIVVNDQTITSSARATSVATAMLARAVDLDTINVTVQLPPAKVNLLKVGQRVQVKFSHLPGYSDDYTYIRASRRTVAQADETDQLYDVTLELYNPYSLGGSGGTASGGTSTPPKTKSPYSAPVTADDEVDGDCAVSLGTAVDVGKGPGAFELTKVGTGYRLSDSTGLGVNGCEIGDTRWFAGPSSGGQYIPITITCHGTGALLLRITMTASLGATDGTSNDFGFYAYLVDHIPTTLDEGILLGSFHAGSVAIDIPASSLPSSGTRYLLLSPISRTVDGQLCLSNLQTPVKAHVGHAYGYTFDDRAAHWMAIDGSQTGTADWLPVVEAANGSRTTFTLSGWDGTGSPQVAVNGLQANIASIDTDAGTVTLSAPPPTGALVTARYHVVT